MYIYMGCWSKLLSALHPLPDPLRALPRENGHTSASAFTEGRHSFIESGSY